MTHQDRLFALTLNYRSSIVQLHVGVVEHTPTTHFVALKETSKDPDPETNETPGVQAPLM